MRLFQVLALAGLCAGPSLALQAQSPVIGEMYASDASVRGSVLFASGGTKIESGSSLTAGGSAAILKLNRGGEVRVCPKTTLSVTSATNGRNLMMGMNTGAVEAHYRLEANSDTLLTPDFRILLVGPGVFHFAISADDRGNACVRALPYNTASLIVSELNGDGTYQVKPNEQIEFHNGKLANPDALVPPDCGCPPENPVPVLKADSKLPVTPPATQTVPPARETHLEMDTPLVYRAGDPEQEITLAVSRLRLTEGPVFPDLEKVEAPVTIAAVANPAPQQTAKKKQPKGFFGHVRSFFGAMFH